MKDDKMKAKTYKIGWQVFRVYESDSNKEGK